jgi:transcriptional repressor NrdR
MKCPFCAFTQDKVIDSRESKDADSIRRRRECERCNKRFTTYERLDEIPYMVVKKDGRREKFDRQKVLSGLLHSCQKRKVSVTQMQEIVDAVEAFVIDSPSASAPPPLSANSSCPASKTSTPSPTSASPASTATSRM